jgi:hypothetical protein
VFSTYHQSKQSQTAARKGVINIASLLLTLLQIYPIILIITTTFPLLTTHKEGTAQSHSQHKQRRHGRTSKGKNTQIQSILIGLSQMKCIVHGPTPKEE